MIGCNQFVTKDHYPADIEILGELADWPDVLSRGGTSIYSPLGETVAGPLLGEEGVLYADLDLDDIARGKFDFDVIGHYARPDVFQLRVNEAPMKAVGSFCHGPIGTTFHGSPWINPAGTFTKESPE